MTTTSLVRVIDLCGRAEPRVMEVASLQDVLGLNFDDVEHILNMWADGQQAFIGEFEYIEEMGEP